MLKRLKWGVFNFLLTMFMGFLLCGDFIYPCIGVFLLIYDADIFFLNPTQYGKASYVFLIINRLISIGFVFFIVLQKSNTLTWALFAFYVLETIHIAKNQFYDIDDEIAELQIEIFYKTNFDELEKILDDKQKVLLKKIGQMVDEDRMCDFIAAFRAREIKQLLKMDINNLALLIQKGDMDTIQKYVQEI